MPAPAKPNRTGNRLLNRLSKPEYKLLMRSEQTVFLPHGEEIYRPQGVGDLTHVYFPTSGMISLTVLMEDGKEIEAGTIGNEGMIGLSAALGLDFSPVRAISQISGQCLRIAVPAFIAAMRPGGTLDVLVRRYTAYSLRYANQTVACNLLHSVEARICRWLLMCHDRAGKDAFTLTHEFLGQMLGIRRQTVTGVAGKLQTASVISYRRGVIRILNRQRLETASCECYAVTREFYDRIMQ